MILSLTEIKPSFVAQIWTVCLLLSNFSIFSALGKTTSNPSNSRITVVTIKKINNIKIISGIEDVDVAVLGASSTAKLSYADESGGATWQAVGRSQANLVQEARMKGYEGESCTTCGQFTMVRNGSCLKCASCGATSGCS